MSKTTCCPRCAAAIPADAPAGLCPNCLMNGGLARSNDDLEATNATGRKPPLSGFVPPPPGRLAACLPQFEILELLGQGGMGAVYKARQKSLDRIVALKIINPAAAADPGFAQRFSREARALARLNHPNIVSVYDSGEADLGGPSSPSGSVVYYIVMEYVDGTHLRHLIAARTLSPAEALAIVPQICAALQFAHDEGIVHRDIKPENILIDRKGRVKIADFGLAKLLGASAGEPHNLTGTHQVMGTPRYMAPEQMEGARAVDHRADIYSLGVVFYEMLTGELPLGIFEPPSRKVQVDVRLDEVVLRSLAKEPERRYQHASDISTAVTTIAANGAPAHRVPVAALAPSPGWEADRAAGKPRGAQVDDGRVWWQPAGWGLALLAPVLALVGFAMWYTGSPWVLGALVFLWGAIGATGGYCSDEATKKAINAVAFILFLTSIGMIAWAISVTHSAWPLGVIPAAVAGLFTGGALGEAVAKAERKTSGTGHPQGESQEKGEQKEEEEDENETPLGKLQSTAWWVGALGVYRCWNLVSDSEWSEWFDRVGVLSFAEAREFVLHATGPVILLAAIGMYRARFYFLSLLACGLCTLSASILGLIVGVWSLITLFNPEIRQLFYEQAGWLPGHAGTPPAGKPGWSPGYNAALGSTLGTAWAGWWRERDAVFTKLVQGVLLLLHLACLFAFLCFRGSGEADGAGGHRFRYEIGLPSPWFTMETASSGFEHVIHWSSTAWIVAMLGFALCYVNWRIERVRHPEAGFWHKPQAMLVVWGVLGIGSIGLGAVMGQLQGTVRRVESSLLEGREKPTELQTAAMSGNLDQVRMLLGNGQSANEYPSGTASPLWWAVTVGDPEMVRLLIKSAADVNAAAEHGISPLMVAAALGHEQIVAALLEAGAEAEARDSLAASTDHVLKGADDAELLRWPAGGQTALMLAVRGEHVEVVRRLLAAGADLNAKDKAGQTAAVLIAQSANKNLQRVYAEALLHASEVTAEAPEAPQP